MELSGTVTSGLGRAHVFMAQSHYQEQFKTVLGSGAWPGTLNVDILEDGINTYQELRIIAGLENQSTGDVIIDGNLVNNTRASERDLAMVFQSYALYPLSLIHI